MSKRKSRSWLLKGEVEQQKGDLPYWLNLQKARQSEINKLYFSQRRMAVKVRDCKRVRIIKLAKYELRVTGGLNMGSPWKV